MYSYGSNKKEVCDRLIGFFKGAYSGVWKCISLQYPYQDDGSNCGIFTIMNIAYITDVLTNATLNKVWGEKTVPCKRIREALAAKLIHKTSNIDDILKVVKA
jgi:hypothetical protein